MKKLKLFVLLLICTFIFAPILHGIWIWSILRDEARAWVMFRSFDRFANGATRGNERETISERAARGTLEGKRNWCILCKFLHLFDKNHCEKVLQGNTPRWDTVPQNSPQDK